MYLQQHEMYYIEFALKEKKTITEISTFLKRHYNTIYNEIKYGSVSLLNSDYTERLEYSADYSIQKHKQSQQNKGRSLKIGNNQGYSDFLENCIKQGCSPYTALIKANEKGYNNIISLSTLYNYIRRGLFCDVDIKDLPYYKKRQKKAKLKEKRLSYNNKGLSIDFRPYSVNKRLYFGHWELDTVESKKGSDGAILSFIERKTRFLICQKVKVKSQSDVLQFFDSLELLYPTFKKYFKSVTTDNGIEFLNYEDNERSIYSGKRFQTYFAHPYYSGERGSVENVNRFIRRYFPKGTDFNTVTNEQLQEVVNIINNTPRRLLNGLTARQYATICGFP